MLHDMKGRAMAFAILGGALLLQGSQAPVFAKAPGSKCDQVSEELYGSSLVLKGGVASKAKVAEPTKVRDVRPSYPTKWPKGCTTSAIHEVLIAPSGKVERVWTLRSPCPDVNKAMVAAIRQWEYTPTLVDEKAVPVCMSVTTLVTLR